MGKYIVEITPDARKELKKHYKSGNKPLINKIEKILLELSETPFVGEGKPEPLKNNYSGYWSRRLNKEHRLVYRIEEEIVTVYLVSVFGHYDD